MKKVSTLLFVFICMYHTIIFSIPSQADLFIGQRKELLHVMAKRDPSLKRDVSEETQALRYFDRGSILALFELNDAMGLAKYLDHLTAE